MKNEINLQDGFLNVVRQQSQPVTIFLTNGFQMRGLVFCGTFGERRLPEDGL